MGGISVLELAFAIFGQEFLVVNSPLKLMVSFPEYYCWAVEKCINGISEAYIAKYKTA